MRRRNDGAGSSSQEEFEDVCFHSLSIIDQNREYLQMHLLATVDLPTRQALTDIQVESARLERTVYNAMTLYRMEKGERGRMRPFDLCALLEKVERLTKEIDQALNIRLKTDDGGMEHCSVMAVPEETELLLLHLLSNALCAGKPEGNVWVSLSRKENGVLLRVEDDGCGLPEENAVENHRHFLGSARMGLRICRLVCDHAGWEFELTARPGGGARAQVAFPLASCEDIPPEAELHSDAEDELRAARFASRAEREILLLRKY